MRTAVTLLLLATPLAAAEYRPTRVPDRVILTWSGDPATTQSVSWRTDTSVDEAVAQLTVAKDGPDLAEGAETFPADSKPLTAPADGSGSAVVDAHYHTVTFTGLEPQTLYAYRVGDGEVWSEWFQFETASKGPKEFSFIYLGDAQNDIRSRWSRVLRQAFRHESEAAFLLHAGDLVNRADADEEWGEWFHAGGWLFGSVPSIATPGNHEQAKEICPAGIERRRLSLQWRPTFSFPLHGPEGLEETVYYLDYQGTRIVSLNSNAQQLEQVDWLRDVLSDNPARWTILTFHHPMYSSGRDRDNSELRAIWQPVFDEFAVDLVLQGHDHTYARSGLVVGSNAGTPSGPRRVVSEKAGTVYVNSVSGPKMYDAQDRPQFRRVAEDTQLYQIIEIDGDELEFEAYTAAGKLYDAFELKKVDGEPNELIDKTPKTPERRRKAAVALDTP